MKGVLKALSIMLVLGVMTMSQQSYGQDGPVSCTVNEVDVMLKPSAPLQFQFFPIALLGIGEGSRAGAIGAFSQFGIGLRNTNQTTARNLDIQIQCQIGGRPIFSRPLTVLGIQVQAGARYFIGVPQLLSGELPRGLLSASLEKPKIDREFVNDLAGGLPSGRFEFVIFVGETGLPFVNCGSIIAEVLTGSTVDLIVPANHSETSALPLFQWAAVGGTKFRLTVARLKPRQTEEDALNTSSQRLVVELNNLTSFQLTAGGPSNALENNLTWNPGLAAGEYIWRVAMIQEDPTTGTSNTVRSRIQHFTVGGGASAGLNTDQIIAILQTIPGLSNIDEQLKGFRAIAIEYNGQNLTADELRQKIQEFPEAVKVKTSW
jgi:hypothetical protein